MGRSSPKIYQKPDGTASLFYANLVIYFNNGMLALFDTKTSGSEPDFCAKHNALIAYLETYTTERGKPYISGMIATQGERESERWKSPFRISSSDDTSRCALFVPGVWGK